MSARISGAVRSVRGAAQRMVALVRRATHAHGAGRSGLGNLIETQAINSAGDALVAVALAGTIFFGLDVHQARGQVVLYLIITMAPFALVAPLIGPSLDRMRSARRIAIAGTMLARGLLCWGMAGAVLHSDEVTLLPAAFGVLVLSKAFGVLRNAITPQVLPHEITLVTANARTSFAGLIAASVTVPVAAGLERLIGPAWLLRIAVPVFVLGALLGLRLPGHVDAPESTAQTQPPGGGARWRTRWRTLLRMGPTVGEAMLANTALRAFSGFLILYLAFLLREQRFAPVSPNIALGLLAACAGAGGLAGTLLGAQAKARAPQPVIFGTLAFVTVVAAVSAVFFGLWAALAVAFVGAFGQSLGKLSMDAIVQREIGEEARSSTFAMSETLHQLVWVLGGLAGLAMSMGLDGRAALSIIAALLGASLVLLLTQRVRRAGPARRPSPPRRTAESAGGDSPEAAAERA